MAELKEGVLAQSGLAGGGGVVASPWPGMRASMAMATCAAASRVGRVVDGAPYGLHAFNCSMASSPLLFGSASFHRRPLACRVGQIWRKGQGRGARRCHLALRSFPPDQLFGSAAVHTHPTEHAHHQPVCPPRSISLDSSSGESAGLASCMSQSLS